MFRMDLNSTEPHILVQTDEWVVVNKPAGWLTIPGRDPVARHPVLTEWLARSHTEIWTVHRLDLETSGAVLFARTAEAHRKANGWFERHETVKIYDCLAHGMLAMPVVRVKSPVGDQSALSQIEVKEAYQEGFAAQVRILTGRRHQIRVHLASLGHPIWGDHRYGGKRSLAFSSGITLEVGRVALHAARLELPSGEKFIAPLPDDFLLWLEVLRNEGAAVG